MKKTLVISAYACCGKTYATKHFADKYSILDLNSLDFKYTTRYPNAEEIEAERQHWESTLRLLSTEAYLNKFKNKPILARDPDFPNNYIQNIKENIGKFDIIFVDSDLKVRESLSKSGIDFVTVYPYEDYLTDWIGRMYLRDDTDMCIRNQIAKWGHNMKYIQNEPYGDRLFRLPFNGEKYISRYMIEFCFTLERGINGGNE